MGIKLLKLLKTPLKVGFLYTEVINLLFSQLILTSRNKKVLLTGKRVKNPKKSAIFDHTLLKGHHASFEDFTILLKENNKFKLHLKEYLLIKLDKPELNRNIYSYPLELFD